MDGWERKKAVFCVKANFWMCEKIIRGLSSKVLSIIHFVEEGEIACYIVFDYCSVVRVWGISVVRETNGGWLRTLKGVFYEAESRLVYLFLVFELMEKLIVFGGAFLPKQWVICGCLLSSKNGRPTKILTVILGNLLRWFLLFDCLMMFCFSCQCDDADWIEVLIAGSKSDH